MELRFAHLADFATHDARGKLIIVGVFDVVGIARGTAAALPTSFIVANIRASSLEGTRHAVQLRVTDADGGEVLPRRDIPLELAAETGGYALSANLVIQLGATPLPGAGDYAIRFYERDTQLGEIAFRVVETDPAPGS
jgi:hypothetical protein